MVGNIVKCGMKLWRDDATSIKKSCTLGMISLKL